MKTFARTISVLALAGCASASGRAPPTTPTPAPAAPAAGSAAPIVLRVPPRVGAFGMVDRRDYDDPREGTMLRYFGPDSLFADVFVYPGPDLASECPVACAQPHLDSEISQFRETIPELLLRGYFQTMTIAVAEPLLPPPDAPWKLGHHLRLAVMRDSVPQRSEFYLYYLPGFKVKVRSTFEENEARVAGLASFLNALMPELLAPAPPPD